MEVEETINNAADNNIINKDEEEAKMTMPGFRFHPTDQELVEFYLRRKVEKKPISIELIKHVDIYKYEPWDLAKISTVGDKEWYFYCMRGRKYKNSIRPNRATGCGFWKATGIDKPIYSSSSIYNNGEKTDRNNQLSCIIGLKKSLVFYRGSAGKGTKTDWMMHEFRLPPTWKINSNHPNSKDMVQEAEIWTLCRIFKRNKSHKKCTEDMKQKIKDNHQHSIFKTCSLGFHENGDQYTNIKALGNHPDDANHFLMNDDDHHHDQVPVAAHQSSLFTSSNNYFLNSNANYQVLGDGTWDQLRSDVEVVFDPSYLYGNLGGKREIYWK